MTKLLVVGNSHLASFKNAYQDSSGVFSDVDATFVPLNFVSKKWLRFDLNQSFRKFRVSVPGQPVRNVDFTGEVCPVHLIFVGRGLFGDGIVRCHGSLTHQNTPQMPQCYVRKSVGSDGGSHLSIACLRHIYEVDVRRRLTDFQAVASSSHFESVHWVASPDMTLRAALARFGQEVIDDNLYAFHRDIYFEAYKEVEKEFDGMHDRVLLHPDSFLDQSGFTDTRFSLKARPAEDIHVSPEFFVPTLNVLGHRLRGVSSHQETVSHR
ncbi:MAG: hypothetical protein ACQEV6_08190 [Pseudomonadota bacterium]